MLLAWESKVLNRIYKTNGFTDIVGKFPSLDTFDYGQMAHYCYQLAKDAKPIPG